MVFVAELTFNAAVAVVDSLVLRRLRAAPSIGRWLATGALPGLAALTLAFLLSLGCEEPAFRLQRLAAYGIFLHGPILLAAGAAILFRPWRKTALLSAAGAALLAAVGVDAFLIEPHWLDVTRIEIRSPKVRRPVRIAVIADPQADEFGDYEKRSLDRALSEGADLILFAGDYLQADEHTERRLEGEYNAWLRERGIAARLGAFAVEGNCDLDQWKGIFEGLPVQLVDRTQTFDLGDLRLTCLSQRQSFRYWEYKPPPRDPDRFTIVLGHSPNFALAKPEADLLVAGHTHGGQVRLPWFGPLVTNTRVPRPWASGLNQLPNGARLLVSRGIGMERLEAPRVRFLCRPELLIVELVPEDAE